MVEGYIDICQWIITMTMLMMMTVTFFPRGYSKEREVGQNKRIAQKCRERSKRAER